MASRYIALIPAYEPDRKMLGVIADLGKKGFDVVVVDDGSGTEYAEIFEQASERLPGKSGKGVTLLIHDINRGKGAALKTGLDFIGNFMVIKGQEKETVVVTIDADGQHLARDAFRVAWTAGTRPGTLVLGSRKLADSHQPGGQIPLRSRFGNSVTRHVFHMVTGAKIYDTQTGLRAFTADLIPQLLSVKGDRYEYEINMLMELSGKGIPVEEVGIETVYLDGNSSSHFDTVKDSYRVYREIAAYAFKRGSAGSSGMAETKRTGMNAGDMTAGTGTIKQAAKFSASSFISFLIDYAMYALLLMIGPGLVFANIGARFVSSAINFTINRKIVFRSGKNTAVSAVQYFALAAFILAGNTFVLQTMTASLGIGRMLAKILTEILFFIISWTVQKYVVFYNPQDEEQEKRLPDRFLVEYSAVRPKKLRDAHREGARKAN